MKYFAVFFGQNGTCIPETTLRAFETLPKSRGLRFRWHSFGHAAVLIAWDDDYDLPTVVGDREALVVGLVRLDNRAELEMSAGARAKGMSDLELVLRVFANHGAKYVPKFLGDFGFVVWKRASPWALAACDAFALKKLYYIQQQGLIAFASRAEALAVEERYEPQYFAELVAQACPAPGLSPYTGVHPVPPGSIVHVEHGRLITSRYWTPHAYTPQPALANAEQEAAERCRQLLTEAVRLRLGNNGDTWAQLSGGMDSSSVVSIAQWLRERGDIPHGLGGTVTFVDRQSADADERAYSNTVVDRWPLRNETIVDPPLWYDEEYPIPLTDLPRMDYPFHPRDQRCCAIVRRGGGRVMLTGVGGDELFTGFMYFFADWVAQGRLWAATREVVRRAAIGRVSFWWLIYENVLLPLLPRIIRNRLVRAGGHVPAWVPRATAERYELRNATYAAAYYGGRWGHKFEHAVHIAMDGLGRSNGPGVVGDALELRHPFLYRPLVEFALQLPPELCVRPHQRKWVLREAMRGILPDTVRTRVGKGSPAELFAWSLTALRPLLQPLLQEPILADLGAVEPGQLRAAFDTIPQQPRNIDQRHASLYTTLALETWLQVRAGRWPRGSRRSITATT